MQPKKSLNADIPTDAVIDLTKIPLVINDVIFGLERKILETEFNELKYDRFSDDRKIYEEYLQDLSYIFDLYKNSGQSEKARRTFLRIQSLTGEESRPAEYQGPITWDFDRPTGVIHEGFDLTVEDSYGNVSGLFTGSAVTYRLDSSANYFTLLRIKINEPTEIENISFDVISQAEDIVFKFLGDNGEVPLLSHAGRVSLDVRGLTRTLEIAVVYPVPKSVTLSGLTIRMRQLTAAPRGPKKIG
ncbi:MAG TPA: hypothetical protein VGL10_02695 [Gammaproteobacteria bacterium]